MQQFVIKLNYLSGFFFIKNVIKKFIDKLLNKYKNFIVYLIYFLVDHIESVNIKIF